LNFINQQASFSNHRIMCRFSYCLMFFIYHCNMQYYLLSYVRSALTEFVLIKGFCVFSVSRPCV
jgi:hypothetical protein